MDFTKPFLALSADGRGFLIFGFEIYFYALMIVGGMVLAAVLSTLLFKRRNISTDFVYLLFIVCIPSALLCARLYYCITDGMHISQWFAWDSIRSGGLSILGGVLGGILSGGIVCLITKVNFLRAADCVLVNILLAQAIGRWGNFFNQEVYGAAVTDPAFQWFPFAVYIDAKGGWYQALFFYESVINAVGFILLYLAAWNYTRKPNGVIGCLYFVWYGSVRSLMEPMRNPSYILGNGTDIMWSQLTSILLVAVGLVAIAVLLIVNYVQEGSPVGSKRGDWCGITKFMTPYKSEKPYFSRVNILGDNYPVKGKEEKEKK